MWQVKNPCPWTGWNRCLTVKIKICDYMTRYLIILITFLSQNKVEKKIKNIDVTMLQLGIPGHDNCLFIYSLIGNLLQNNWCCEMYDHLKGFIFRFNLNFLTATDSKREWILRWQIPRVTLVCLTVSQFNPCKQFVFNIILSNHFN